jgi:hypothetical protein
MKSQFLYLRLPTITLFLPIGLARQPSSVAISDIDSRIVERRVRIVLAECASSGQT